MKRLALFAILMFSISAVFAQKGKVSAASGYLDTNDVDAAKKAIDQAIENEKSMNWPKTYIIAAKVYTELAKSGQDADGIKKAVDFYKKAIELDQKGDEKGKGIGKYEKEIKLQLTFFKPDLTNSGIEGFNTENFEQALFAFENVLYINALPMFQEEAPGIDTAIVYNCALAAYNAKDWNRAEKYFNQSIDLGYGGGDAVLLLDQVFDASGDSTKVAENLQRGFQKYPEDERILTTLIQYYLDAQQNDAALEYLNTAIEKDPENPSFYYARGVLYESIDKDEAIKNYEKCLEIDNKFFNALYNIGVIYYNKGVEQQNVANDKTTTKEFNAAMKVANEFWEKSLPYMESAHEVQPEEAAVLETLKGLYYRFERMDKYNEVKAKIDALN
ncbi:tetratricopeptide repeat protein [Carboxylicivirga sediminis]|uniref:Tetratricopeptide repeat protein n=1 Tax=Carboxylicivirga sediminis TaxID=2006564 RepID=A0A941IWF8_9BACT|nr:tetratricopeptide repeat protein [Carboxylicivirga sediminis]MBR8535756.1 tetratricopeptide repeat protein [Carboxylicivirga sediminis]